MDKQYANYRNALDAVYLREAGMEIQRIAPLLYWLAPVSAVLGIDVQQAEGEIYRLGWRLSVMVR